MALLNADKTDILSNNHQALNILTPIYKALNIITLNMLRDLAAFSENITSYLRYFTDLTYFD